MFLGPCIYMSWKKGGGRGWREKKDMHMVLVCWVKLWAGSVCFLWRAEGSNLPVITLKSDSSPGSGEASSSSNQMVTLMHCTPSVVLHVPKQNSFRIIRWCCEGRGFGLTIFFSFISMICQWSWLLLLFSLVYWWLQDRVVVVTRSQVPVWSLPALVYAASSNPLAFQKSLLSRNALMASM